jgi:hypothetical protein
MARAVQQIRPIAHLPLVLGVLRHLEVATVVDRLIPSHSAHVLSCGRGSKPWSSRFWMTLMPSMRDTMALLQPGLTRASQCWRGKDVSSPRGAALAPSSPTWLALGWPTTPLFAPAWLINRGKFFLTDTKGVRPVHGPPAG